MAKVEQKKVIVDEIKEKLNRASSVVMGPSKYGSNPSNCVP